MLDFWLRLCMREWKRLLSNRCIVFILIGGPFFYATIFGTVYWQGRTRHVPIVIVDQDHSALSREITRALQASENLSVVGWINSPEGLLHMARREAAYVCVVFPPAFEHDVLAGKQSRVGIIFDGSNTLIAGVASNGIRAVLGTYEVGIAEEELKAEGVPAASALNVAVPLQQTIRPLFNPTYNYGYFILMGLVCVAIQSVTRIGCGISLEQDDIVQMKSAFPSCHLAQRTVFLSKVIATAAIALPIAYTALSLPFLIFGAPFRGSLLVLCAALTVFVVTQICIGYGYSALCKSAVFCTQLHLFMSTVVFTLSGFTWPYYAMPSWIYGIATLMPLFHMNCLVRKTALVGAQLYTVWPHLLALLVFCALAIAWGYWSVGKSMARIKAQA